MSNISAEKTMAENRSVVIIVIVHNRTAELTSCLVSLKAALRSEDQVVVFDNGSSDQKGLDTLRKQFSAFYWERSDINLGFAGANNHCIRTVLSWKPRYIFLLNPDTQVSAGLFDQMERASRNMDDQSILTPLLTRPEQDGNVRIDSAGLHMDRFYRSVDDSQGMLLANSPFKNANEPIPIWGICGASIWIPVSLFPLRDDISQPLFRSDYFMYAEDAEFSWYWKKRGGSVYLIPWLHVIHQRKGNSKLRRLTARRWKAQAFVIECFILNRYKTIVFHETCGGFIRNLPFFLTYETIRWAYILVFKPYLWRLFFKSLVTVFNQLRHKTETDAMTFSPPGSSHPGG
jgi:hypothetical protein